MRLLILFALFGSVYGTTDADRFEQKVRPVLAKRCYACHTATKTAGLRVDSREALLAGGKSGPAIVPGDVDRSLLIQAVRQESASLKMPPGAKLDPAEIEALENWVRQGAQWPEALSARAGNLWSAGPLSKPVSKSIDEAVHHGLVGKNLIANQAASKRTLLRRLTFDLIGLPPTPEELDTFLLDTSPKATEKVVDRLIASPHFGERWARHWLDVARFGEDDFTGTAVKPYPNAWRYRDWVVNAFNSDMPYDKFIHAQIAADQMPGDNSSYIGGLGMLGLGPWYFGISQPAQARADERNDRIDVITRGMLGLTVACARCHDHKYDPIPTKDYYALGGVFASVQYKEYPLASVEEVARYTAANKEIQDLEARMKKFLDQQADQLAETLSSRVAEYLVAAWKKNPAGLDAEIVDRWAGYLKKTEDNHPYMKAWRAAAAGTDEAEVRKQSELVETNIAQIIADKKKLDEENTEIVAKNKKPKPGRDYVLPFGYRSESDFNPGAEIPTKSLERDRYVWYNWLFTGDKAILRLPGEKMDRFLTGEWKRHVDTLRAQLKEKKEKLPSQYAFYHGVEDIAPMDMQVNVRGNPDELGEVIPRHFLTSLSKGEPVRLQQGSGRLQLAMQVASHPMARRVMANRVWLHLFGSGVVRTPSNFGVMGERPANAELLEYLAWQFDQKGLSVKKLVREIVLSATYQSASNGNVANDGIDPDNRYFWRANRRRLDAEAIRDTILSTAGTLDPKVGGESKPMNESSRRTIYVRVGRFQQEETLALFDFPSASVSNESRVVTNVPLQKLFFLNSAFVLDQSKAFAKRFGPDVRKAYQLAYGRDATENEIDLAGRFFASAGEKAPEQFAQVLLSSNEFAFID